MQRRPSSGRVSRVSQPRSAGEAIALPGPAATRPPGRTAPACIRRGRLRRLPPRTGSRTAGTRRSVPARTPASTASRTVSDESRSIPEAQRGSRNGLPSIAGLASCFASRSPSPASSRVSVEGPRRRSGDSVKAAGNATHAARSSSVRCDDLGPARADEVALGREEPRVVARLKRDLFISAAAQPPDVIRGDDHVALTR